MATIKIPQLTRRTVDRFWKKVKALPSGCWEWQSRKGSYGAFSIDNRKFKSHRLAYFIYYITDPGDLCVLHRCDNPPCVNPLHLFLGTREDNIKDMIAKGRDRLTIPRGDQKGEKNAQVKLTAAAIQDIRSRCSKGKWGIQRILAKEYGVAHQTISEIICCNNWKHV